MCTREAIGASSMLRLIRRVVALGVDSVESSAEDTELVLVVLRMLNS